jgi:hypothetical protein
MSMVLFKYQKNRHDHFDVAANCVVTVIEGANVDRCTKESRVSYSTCESLI